MKKAFLAAGFFIAVVVTASAQTKKAPPPPPKPPAPPTELKIAPPPPPAPGQPPAPPAPPPPPVPSDADITELPKDYQDFLARNPSVGSIHWTENSVVIVPKKGKAEKYALDEKGMTQAEAKYGKLPAAPPPPPIPPAPPKLSNSIEN